MLFRSIGRAGDGAPLGVALGVGAALLGEPVTAPRLSGGALILGAVLLLARADLTRSAASSGAGLGVERSGA